VVPPPPPPIAPPPIAPPPLADDPFAQEPFVDEPFADETLEDDGLEDEEPEGAARERISLAERLKRTPPALVILALAAIGSTGFMAFELATRTAPIAVLSSGAAVMGLCYIAIAIVCAVATYRSAAEGRTRRAFLLAFIGGSAAIVAASAFAGGLLLVLALGF